MPVLPSLWHTHGGAHVTGDITYIRQVAEPVPLGMRTPEALHGPDHNAHLDSQVGEITGNCIFCLMFLLPRCIRCHAGTHTPDTCRPTPSSLPPHTMKNTAKTVTPWPWVRYRLWVGNCHTITVTVYTVGSIPRVTPYLWRTLLRNMICEWQILKYTSTRLRVNLAAGGDKCSGRKARVSWGAGREGGKMHAGVAHAWSPCKKE